MATHKDLSNFPNADLAKYNHLMLKIAELKASLTTEQANMTVPQSVTINIDNLSIQLPEIPKPKKLTFANVLDFLTTVMKSAPIFLPKITEIVESISHHIH